MTVIVGLAFRGRTILGGDASVSWDDSIVACGEPKVWRHDEQLLLGMAGDLKADAMRYYFAPPPYDGVHAHAYMVRSFVPALRSALKAADASDVSFDVLVGLAGRLFSVDNSGGVHSWACGYGAIGAAQGVSLGSLHSTNGSAMLSPRERLKVALEAAATHCTVVRPPWCFVPDELL